VAAVLVLLAVAVFLRSKAPPEAARLLPESDGIVYVDFKPLRAFAHKALKPPKHDAEYQQFLDAVGIDPEQDLDQAAVALHAMQDPSGPNGAVAYSMVLVGRLTGKRLNGWLESHAVAREDYGGHTIYSVQSEGRTVRVAQIGYDMMAVSNYPTPEKIHSIIDRHRTAALPFSGSTLLEHHYHDVPLLSLAWGVGKIGLPFSERGALTVFGLRLPLEADANIVASVRWAGSMHVRVEEFAPNEEKARAQAVALSELVTLARTLTGPLGNNAANSSFQELVNDATVEQKHDRVVVRATLSPSLLAGVLQ
jgi:hypothetical protein